MSHLINEVTTALVPIVATGIVGLLAYFAKLLVGLYQRHLLVGAVGRAAGQVIAGIAGNPELQGMAAGALQSTMKRLAGDGAAYVERSYPDLVRKLGVQPKHIADMVLGEVGKLLAQKGVPLPGLTPQPQLIEGVTLEAITAPAFPTAEEIADAVARRQAA